MSLILEKTFMLHYSMQILNVRMLKSVNAQRRNANADATCNTFQFVNSMNNMPLTSYTFFYNRHMSPWIRSSRFREVIIIIYKTVSNWCIHNESMETFESSHIIM